MGIGIALAGGGIRGIAHVGVLKALEENRYRNRSN
jgi:predicted acylesterase/phospholipase RssA